MARKSTKTTEKAGVPPMRGGSSDAGAVAATPTPDADNAWGGRRSKGSAGRVEVVPLGRLIPDEANARVRTDRGRDAIRKSIERFGPGRSIVLDGKNVVRAGNGTLEGAAEAGIREVLVVEPAPGQLVAVKRRDWSPAEATAYGIMDNRSAELSEWDNRALGGHFKALSEEAPDLLALTGFEDAEIRPVMAADWSPAPSEGLPDRMPAPDAPITGPVFVNAGQRATFERACESLRGIDGYEKLSEGECLELLAQRYLDGARKPRRR